MWNVMKQCSNLTREVHGFIFKCRDVASVEICYNKESAEYRPYCAWCFENTFDKDYAKWWVVKEIED